ncbi:hypothetical protein ACQ4M3_23435 [Leptolyngbya sp. AN03gr2]|uniref:hypothetical protein n=1 Tax=unclassified Leptolyngbya TaxID=2650499 RepID=UPI003D323424
MRAINCDGVTETAMARQKKSNKALDTGQQILNALTQQEIAQLLNALFEVLPPDLQERSLAQLSEDTQQTIQRILAPSPAADPPQAGDSPIPHLNTNLSRMMDFSQP